MLLFSTVGNTLVIQKICSSLATSQSRLAISIFFLSRLTCDIPSRPNILFLNLALADVLCTIFSIAGNNSQTHMAVNWYNHYHDELRWIKETWYHRGHHDHHQRFLSVYVSEDWSDYVPYQNLISLPLSPCSINAVGNFRWFNQKITIFRSLLLDILIFKKNLFQVSWCGQLPTVNGSLATLPASCSNFSKHSVWRAPPTWWWPSPWTGSGPSWPRWPATPPWPRWLAWPGAWRSCPACPASTCSMGSDWTIKTFASQSRNLSLSICPTITC